MRILIIEPSLSGHHGPYLEWITQALRSAGHDLTLAVNKQEGSHPLYSALAAGSDRFIEMPDRMHASLGQADRSFTEMWKISTKFRRMFGDVYREAAEHDRIDMVFLPYLDYCTYAFSVLGSPFGRTLWGAIAMRPTFHYSRTGIRAPSGRGDTIKARLFDGLLRDRKLAALFTIDESLSMYYAKRGVGGRKLHFLPDPVPQPARDGLNLARNFREELGIAGDVLLVVCYGSLSNRKGIEALVAGLNGPDCPANVHALLAGKQHADAKATLSSEAARELRAQGRLHEIDRFVDSPEQSRILASADVMWVGYIDHVQMSAALVHAGMHAIPSIGCDQGLIGWLINHYDCGVTLDVRDHAAVSRALRRMHDDRERRSQMGRNGREAFSKHAIPLVARDFTAVFDGIIDQRRAK